MKFPFYKFACLFAFILSLGLSAFAQGTREQGIELYNQGKFAESIRVLQNLSSRKEFKTDAVVWNYLGLAYMDDGELKKARKALEKAVELQPQSAPFRVNLAYVYLASRKVDDAQKQTERALELDPQNASAYFLRGSARIREGKLRESLADAEKVIALNPNFAAAYTLKSTAYLYIFGEKMRGEGQPKKQLAYLASAVEPLEFCLQYCRDNKILAAQKERLESLKVFYDYFNRQSLRGPGAEVTDIDAAEKPTEEITPIKILSKPQARYTDKGRGAGIQGTITLYVLFAANGKVSFILPLKTLGYGLDENAINAASQIRFEPARKNGVPVSLVKMVSYSFTIY